MNQNLKTTRESLDKQQKSLNEEFAKIKKEQEELSNDQKSLRNRFIPRSEIQQIAKECIQEDKRVV